MPPQPTHWDLLHRRAFLSQGALGIGSAALATLLAEPSRTEASRPSPLGGSKPPHFAPQAKNIIFLLMAGAPSQLDLFEDKPELRRLDGKTINPARIEGLRFPFVANSSKLLGSPYKFRRHGDSGAIVSELLPHFSGVVDDVTFIKSMHTSNTAINHQDGQLFFTTGALPRSCICWVWTTNV